MKPIVTENQTLDWYAASPKDFFDGTGRYRFEVKAAYRLVLDAIYASPRCELPDKSQDIARLFGMTTTAWNKARAQLIADGKIQSKNGHLLNVRASAYWAENMPKIALNREKIAQKRRKKPAEKQPEKQPVIQEVPAQQGLNLDESAQKPPYARAREIEREREKEEVSAPAGAHLPLGEVMIACENIAKILNQPRGKYWETDYRAMIGRGLTYEDIVAAARAHTSGHIRSLVRLEGLAKVKLQQRIRSSTPKGMVLDAPAPLRPSASTITREQWSTYLQALLKGGIWYPDEAGPSPMHPGCLAPQDMLDRFFEDWIKQGAHPLKELDASSNVVDYPAERPNLQHRAQWKPAT